MKITQQEREQYKLECRARHFASQWLGGEPTASVDEFIECKKRAFCFRHNVKSVEFDKDFLDEFRQGVDAHLDGEQFYLAKLLFFFAFIFLVLWTVVLIYLSYRLYKK